jgi:hypothetical protein
MFTPKPGEWKMSLGNAGGTKGGAGGFFVGIGLVGLGMYLLMRNILVSSSFSLGMGLFHVPMAGHTQAIPAGLFVMSSLVGVALVFFNGKSLLGVVGTGRFHHRSARGGYSSGCVFSSGP